MVDDRILTLHPAGKQGVNIERSKYDLIRQAIVISLQQRDEIPFGELDAAVAANLSVPFDGSIGWYTTTVKLDLEASGVIERVPGRSPQVIRLAQAS
ncbi:MAG TPA: hypothetical protein VL334_14475 [Anaerolineae bacterium]|nr:hypothetical protein [Anaerolineae bacterium]